ncbi:MAG: PrgI family protein [Candidatus Peregrinibacteria bacterium]|nr:PrgI family protein [Candidatus Peregrinibacteria bacterium]
MAIEPVKIPQNVYVEDRIVGPLTLKQTIIILGGGGFSYALWAMSSKAYGQPSVALTIVTWIPCVIAVAFALVRVNDLSLIRMCMLIIEKMSKPRIRVWTPRTGLTIHIRTIQKTAPAPRAAEDRQQPDHIRELSSILDGGFLVTPAAPAKAEVLAAEPQMSVAQAPAAHSEEGVEEPPRSTLPVNPTRIAVDQRDSGKLQVFRDIFPQHS